MGKIHMLIGKSSSGKDTIKNLLIKKFTPEEWNGKLGDLLTLPNATGGG